MQNLLWVIAFGILGISCRYGVDQMIDNSTFPLSTFLINMAGSFLAGLIFALGERQDLSPSLQTGLLVGFCGGFTTFSAYALQTFLLLEEERFLPAFGYLFLSPALGLLAAFLPIFVMRKL